MDLLNLTDPWSPLGPAASPHLFSSATGPPPVATHHHHHQHAPAQTPAAWLPSCALSQYPSLVPASPAYSLGPASASAAVAAADTAANQRASGLPPYALAASGKQLTDMIHVTSAVSSLSSGKDPWASLSPN